MGTAFIPSKQDKANASKVMAAIDAGQMPHPPALHGKVNECAKCGKGTMLARYYIPQVGYSCETCWTDWRTTPAWCDTRASDVHLGRWHIIPQCVIDAEAKSAPVTPQGSRSAKSTEITCDWVSKQVAKINDDRGKESIATEKRWHDARNMGEANRGNVMVMPWRVAA